MVRTSLWLWIDLRDSLHYGQPSAALSSIWLGCLRVLGLPSRSPKVRVRILGYDPLQHTHLPCGWGRTLGCLGRTLRSFFLSNSFRKLRARKIVEGSKYDTFLWFLLVFWWDLVAPSFWMMLCCVLTRNLWFWPFDWEDLNVPSNSNKDRHSFRDFSIFWLRSLENSMEN